MKSIEKAREVIENSGLVIFPTETAYGIAADAMDREAIEKVYRAKKRPKEKGLTVIVDSLEQAEKHAELGEKEKKVVEEFMPGPLTLVAEKKENVPDKLNEKFVFRISSSNTAGKLSENGPVTATSANTSGEETSYSVEEISEELKEEVDHIIDEGRLEKRPTSTILEIRDGKPVVHREGPISKKQVDRIIS